MLVIIGSYIVNHTPEINGIIVISQRSDDGDHVGDYNTYLLVCICFSEGPLLLVFEDVCMIRYKYVCGATASQASIVVI